MTQRNDWYSGSWFRNRLSGVNRGGVLKRVLLRGGSYKKKRENVVDRRGGPPGGKGKIREFIRGRGDSWVLRVPGMYSSGLLDDKG